jgi:hypothetical protein
MAAGYANTDKVKAIEMFNKNTGDRSWEWIRKTVCEYA